MCCHQILKKFANGETDEASPCAKLENTERLRPKFSPVQWRIIRRRVRLHILRCMTETEFPRLVND
jgi:hypothetical protein